MKGINQVMLLGNLGLDPDLRYTKAGTPVCNLRVATNTSYEDASSQPRLSVEWHNVTVWGSQGVAAAGRLVQGCAVLVHGRLESHRYFNKEDQEVRSWNVVANDVIFITTKDDFICDEPDNE
jgi:single-strand DNA-binding protein